MTAVAFVDGRFVEVDAIHLTKELKVEPRGQKLVASQMDYFCATSDGNQLFSFFFWPQPD